MSPKKEVKHYINTVFRNRHCNKAYFKEIKLFGKTLQFIIILVCFNTPLTLTEPNNLTIINVIDLGL